MKPYERRAANAYPYYGLARWDNRLGCWKAGRRVFETIAAAENAATACGRYRIARINESGREDVKEFRI